MGYLRAVCSCRFEFCVWEDLKRYCLFSMKGGSEGGEAEDVSCV